MLQQTQVATVIPYYDRFLETFPDVNTLAYANIDRVLHLWTGLGYYARARNLHKAARLVVDEHAGEFPHDLEKLQALPGIGRSTAGAIAALSMGIRAPILDGNVKRVLTRYFAVEGYPEQSDVNKKLWRMSEKILPQSRVDNFTQGMMDLGSTVCTRTNPACDVCPLSADCKALRFSTIDQFPGKKPGKEKPVKTVRMPIIQNSSGEVLLEKRPPSGIWGGLYSLPEFEVKPLKDASGKPGKASALVCGPGLPVDYAEEKELPALRHTFSHYHLDITPVLGRVKNEAGQVAESGAWLWYPLDQSLEVGLAAPIKKILSQLRESQ